MVKHRYIATKLHHAIELSNDPYFRRCTGLPHYVIDPSLMDLLTRSDVGASIKAMVEANVCNLPFPKLLLEIAVNDGRYFITLQEHHGEFVARAAVLYEGKGDISLVDVDPNEITVHYTGEHFHIATNGRSHEIWLKLVGLSVGIALLMLNIQGVVKQVIEPTRLNKSRAARGSTPIPSHTVIRIGHVYNREGKQERVATGRTMPVHLRAGHARHQRYGPENSLTKIVYIPPVLVNFKPGGQAPVPPKRIVAA